MSASRQEVARRLHSAALHLVRAVRTVDVEMGLTPARASALSILVFGGPRTIGELAAAEQVRSPTMTALVHGLEAEGLARRLPSPDDGRKVIVEATEAGRRLLESGRARRERLLGLALSDAGEEDLRLLRRAAEMMEGAVERVASGASEV
ncbi:MAG TPA: MarR family transcriptional regulator [Nitriliruptorales bacterium]|nr:MarR family transcriptional regulator [Nitriliruptorales bacterium]